MCCICSPPCKKFIRIKLTSLKPWQYHSGNETSWMTTGTEVVLNEVLSDSSQVSSNKYMKQKIYNHTKQETTRQRNANYQLHEFMNDNIETC